MSVWAYLCDVFSLVWLSAFQPKGYYELGGGERGRKVGSNKEVKRDFNCPERAGRGRGGGGGGLLGPAGAWSRSEHGLMRLTPHNFVDTVVFGFVPRKKLKRRRKRSLKPQKTIPNPG